MRWRQQFEILMPTILVGAGWLGLSSATTLYITWLDDRHQQVVSEFVPSIRAAAAMQHALWQLQVERVNAAAARDTDATSPVAVALMQAEFRAALDAADAVSFTAEEKAICAQIREKFEQYMEELSRARAARDTPMPLDLGAAMATEIANLCNQLRLINHQLIEQRTLEQARWSRRIVSARVLIAAFGPLTGVWLGYRVARRLQRRLAAIHVTLDGATGEVGRVLVHSSNQDGNLDVIDRQVRDVAARLQHAVSEVELARQEAARNERLAAVGQLAAGVAHELRNPLTAVKLLVQTAVQRESPNGIRAEPLAVVQDEIARMENTIQSLLDFARTSVERRIEVDVREILDRAVNLLRGRADQDKIRLEVSMPDNPVLVQCDPEQLHQVFVNLLLNGLDAMPGGGMFAIELRLLGNDSFTAEPLCEIAFHDQGTGIAPELLDHIFEPFVTTKTRGTGLGLAISRRLVANHGGRISACNRAEGGATFAVQLPCHEMP